MGIPVVFDVLESCREVFLSSRQPELDAVALGLEGKKLDGVLQSSFAPRSPPGYRLKTLHKRLGL